MAVPNIFGSATAAIPLSQLDTNFATAITLGNTAVYLGNTTTSLGNVTLTNVTISSGNVTITGANVSGTANVSTLIVTGNQTSLGNVAITGNISANIATFGAGSNTAPAITTTGDTNTGIFFPAADTIAFTEGGVESMRIDASGNVTLSTGNLIIGTSGKGIDFSATSHPAGMTSELLADYEEGTWTPTFNLGAFTYTLQNGIYTKVGNVVHVTGRIDWSAKSGSGIGLINLPFTAVASPTINYSCSYGYLKGVDTNDLQLIGFLENNAAYIGMVWVNDNGTPGFTDVSNWDATGVVAFSITYQV